MARLHQTGGRTSKRHATWAQFWQERGYVARPVDETARLGFEIDCDDSERSCDELLHEMEMLVGQLGTPFIPVRGDGFVFLRPPSN